jgi:uncharacterized membrane protein
MDAIDTGPVDLIMLKFPGNQFNGEILPALKDLVVRDIVRILDLLFVYKDADGSVGSMEIAGLGPDLQPDLVAITGSYTGGLLDQEDVDEVAPDLEPNSSMALLVVENHWAARFVDAVRGSGGEVVDQVRVPATAVAEARAALEAGDA